MDIYVCNQARRSPIVVRKSDVRCPWCLKPLAEHEAHAFPALASQGTKAASGG